MNSLANESDTIPSTGGQDSILVSYDDLRKVNGKLIELEYDKSIIKSLRSICYNDSIAISSLRNSINNINENHNRDIKRVKKERNMARGISIVSIILLVISIL